MSFVNRPMHIIKGLTKAVKGLKDKVLSLAKVNEDKEKNEKHIGRSGWGGWSDKERSRDGFIRKELARRKKARITAHRSKIVNAGGKKRV